MRSFYNYNDLPVDYIHPNGAGHGKMADVITALLNTAKNASGTPSYSLPSQIFSSPGSYGAMTEVSASSHPGITVTSGQNGSGDTWVTNNASVHKFTPNFTTNVFDNDNYTVRSGWKSIVLTTADKNNGLNYIEFSGIQKSEVIVEWSFSTNYGSLGVVINNDEEHMTFINQAPPAGIESLLEGTVCWTWAAFNLPNQQGGNTIKFIPQTVGKRCIIHRLWLTGSY
jgi:hypothetical protein